MAVDSASAALAQANKAGTAGGASALPFVVAVIQAGIRFVPSIANPGLLVFTISAANSDQYIASRTLYGMARDGHAPKIFMKCNKRGVPWVAFCITSPFMMLAYLVSSSNSLTVFNYFSSAISLFGETHLDLYPIQPYRLHASDESTGRLAGNAPLPSSIHALLFILLPIRHLPRLLLQGLRRIHVV
ncbi:uncharacterized protein I303_106326 [Kwoniella dejecticola CBS 10117]|uniref:Amino acid permease/ SLC12A domain-containing protein n=1 Tax=Kwoniella dejecticola CBS 10117 TaxID=1296121 RepID=A0A1A5ZV15_9TREE|nr:uncharacterized protein I303_08417 [Kwoniella dejecticola CBS 10117]OBR81646.1 hypothetical protein I303_08417 [Kwoniella dejecticola CBS 10117]